MLKEIHFQNWKSFKQATLYIDQLTLLIGTNASGKSNLVESLEFFLRRIAIGKNIQTALSGDSTLSSLRGGLEWIALKSENQFTLSVLVDSYKKQTDYLYSITIKIDSIAQIISESLRCIKYDESSDQHDILFETHPQSRDKQHDITELFKLVYALPSASDDSLSEFPSRQEMMDGAKAVMSSLENIFILGTCMK
jgi:AAA15 family ATPase/GTPase